MDCSEGIIRRSRQGYRLAYVLLTIIFLVLLVYGCSGPRNTDNFWYISEIKTLVSTGRLLCNTIYPGPYLREGISVEDNLVFHNSLTIQIIGIAARIMPPYRAWILINALFCLGAASLLSWSLRALWHPMAGVAGFALYLFFPLSFWQSCTVTQEACLGFWSALILSLYLFSGQSLRRWAGLFLACALSVLVSPLYLPLALLLPVVMLWRLRKSLRWSVWGLAIAAILVVLVSYGTQNLWLPKIFPSGLREILVHAVPGMSNMEWYFRVDLLDVDTSLIVSKITAFFKAQLGMSKTVVFFGPVNVLLLASVVLGIRQIRKGDPRVRQALLATLAFVGVWAGCAMVHQNQARYQMFILPGLLVCGVLWVRSCGWIFTRKRMVKVGSIGLLIVMIGMCCMLARQSRRDGIQAGRACQSVKDQTSFLPENARILYEQGKGSGRGLLISHALHPRTCFMVRLDRLSGENIDTIVASYRPDYLIATADSQLHGAFSPTPKHIIALTPLGETMYLYKVHPGSQLDSDRLNTIDK